MNSYFATFVAGTQDIILRQLKKFPLEQLKVTYIDDGLVTFVSSFPPERLIDFRFFNNTFLLLDTFEGQTLQESLDILLQKALPKNSTLVRLLAGKSPHLVVMQQGVPAVIDQNLQRRIAEHYGAHGDSKAQLWLTTRSGGKTVFGLRLARPPFKRAKRPAGALRPELVHILCLVANVGSKDTVLDTFAGYGSVISECIQGFHTKKVIAVESEEKLLRQLKKDCPNGNAQLVQGSAADLSFLANATVSKVVTDPPWGLYGSSSKRSLLELYRDSLQEIARVLRPGGVAVILFGNDDLTTVAQATKHLECVKKYHVLVSGKKATIVKLRRLNLKTSSARTP